MISVVKQFSLSALANYRGTNGLRGCDAITMETEGIVTREFVSKAKALAEDQGIVTEAGLVTTSLAKDIPEPILLVALTQLSVLDGKLLMEVKKSLKMLSDIGQFCKSLNRKDLQSRLRETLTKPFTGVFHLKEKVEKGRFKLEFLGCKNAIFDCLIPPKLLQMMNLPDFFNEREIYIFTNLLCCVFKEPTPTVFFVFQPSTKVRSVYYPRLNYSKLRMEINEAMSTLKVDLSHHSMASEKRTIPCISQQEAKNLISNEVILKGYISEISNMGSEGNRDDQISYVIKLFHHLTLLDEYKIYVKVFPNHQEEFERVFQPGRLVQIPRVKRAFTADLNFSFRHAYYKNIDYVKGCDDTPINPTATFRERLRMLKAKDNIPVTSLESIGLTYLHRQTIKVIVDLESVLMLELTLKCFGCRNRMDFCGCETPKVNLNTYAKLLVNDNGTPAYLIIQEFDVLTHYLDLSHEEVDFTRDYLRRYGEFSIMVERLSKDTKNYERKKVFSYFNKYVPKKAIYACFISKKDSTSNKENDSFVSKEAMGLASNTARTDYLYVNGSVKLSMDGQKYVLTPILAVKHSEKVPSAVVANALFNNIFASITDLQA